MRISFPVSFSALFPVNAQANNSQAIMHQIANVRVADQIQFSGQQSGQSKIVSTRRVGNELTEVINNPGKQLLWTTDFDGVLRAFCQDPAQSYLNQEQRTFLINFIEKYNQKTGLPFVFVTGRPVEDIIEFVGENNEGESLLKGKPVWINGVHGGVLFDCENWQYQLKGTERQERAIWILKEKLGQLKLGDYPFTKKYPKVVIEAKGHALAIHDKTLSEVESKNARKDFKHIVTYLGLESPDIMGNGTTFIVKEGEGLLEVLPKQFTKGEGLKNVLKRVDELQQAKQASQQELVPVFIGDGLTDNDGFEYLSQDFPEAVTVFVGKPNEKVQAKYTIENTEHTGDIRTDTPEGDAHRTVVSQRNVDAVRAMMIAALQSF